MLSADNYSQTTICSKQSLVKKETKRFNLKYKYIFIYIYNIYHHNQAHRNKAG